MVFAIDLHVICIYVYVHTSMARMHHLSADLLESAISKTPAIFLKNESPKG